ncbi:MAG: MerR family transcriptional regulator [Candidatus Eremiobacteraeota bacterium]|nr:MerR family transcriptional regulator [Candidatus Eremiobacteraeota bacterium]
MSQDLIRIGDLSRETGVPIATLRYYASEGLIECVRTRTKYRMFSEQAVALVQRIVHLKSLKIPLAEIRRILKAGSQTGEARREHVQELRQRLERILEHKQVWAEEERKVRLLLASVAHEGVGGDVEGQIAVTGGAGLDGADGDPEMFGGIR